MERDQWFSVFFIVLAWTVLMAAAWHKVGYTAGRQSVAPVACEPVVVGVRKNGREIPLTSAQRDSLSGVR